MSENSVKNEDKEKVTETSVNNNKVMPESKHSVEDEKLPAKQQWNKNKHAEEKAAEDAAEEPVDVPSSPFLDAAPPTDTSHTGKEEDREISFSGTYPRPGAVRVPGIGHQQTAQQARFDQGQGQDQDEDLDNARRPTSAVAEIVDDAYLFNEFRNRHDVVEAEKIVTVDEGNGKARWQWIAVAVIVVVVTAVVAVVTGVLVSKSEQANPSPISVSTSPIPMALPTASPTTTSAGQRLDAFRSVLLNHNVSSSNHLSDARSTEYESLNWLANLDPVMLSVRASPQIIIHRYVLAVVYFATNGKRWNKKLNFLSNSSTCQWHNALGNGTFCNSTVNVSHVTDKELEGNDAISTLNLVDNNLIGTIPSELGRLSSLTSVRLDSNLLGGTIPSELERLSSLTSLDLFNNALTGTIPSELGRLCSLTYLYLDFNAIIGKIPSELGRLSSLISLDLVNNALTGTIPSELGRLSSLISLDLHFNALIGKIPSELGRLSSLISLNLDNNLLSGTIPSELGRLSNLISLHLHNNFLSGTIPSELGRLSSLTYLGLVNNSLTGTIPSELIQLSKFGFLFLDIDGNHIIGNTTGFRTP